MLHIKKSSLWLSGLLHYGGFIVMILSLPYVHLRVSNTTALLTEEWIAEKLFSLIVPGCIMITIGDFWKGRLYRCPKCKRHLLKRRGGFSQKPPQHCAGCGTEITVCIDEYAGT